MLFFRRLSEFSALLVRARIAARVLRFAPSAAGQAGRLDPGLARLGPCRPRPRGGQTAGEPRTAAAASLGPQQTPSEGQPHAGGRRAREGRHPCPQPGWLCGGGTGHPGAHDGPGGNSRGQEARERAAACPHRTPPRQDPTARSCLQHQGARPAEGQGPHVFQGTHSPPQTASLYLPTTQLRRSRGNTEGSAQNRVRRLPFHVGRVTVRIH